MSVKSVFSLESDKQAIAEIWVFDPFDLFVKTFYQSIPLWKKITDVTPLPKTENTIIGLKKKKILVK